MQSEIEYIRPCNIDELLSCSLWHCPPLPLIGLGFSRQRASVLHKNGMAFYRNIMTKDNFLPIEELKERYGLLPQEEGAWAASIRNIQEYWEDIINTPRGNIQQGEWLGIYQAQEDLVPSIIWRALSNCSISEGSMIINIKQDARLFKISTSSSSLLLEIPKSSCPETLICPRNSTRRVYSLQGVVKRVRIIQVVRGPRKKEIFFHYGTVANLPWDPGRFVGKVKVTSNL